MLDELAAELELGALLELLMELALLAAVELVTTTGVELELPPPPQADTTRPIAAKDASFSARGVGENSVIAGMAAPLG